MGVLFKFHLSVKRAFDLLLSIVLLFLLGPLMLVIAGAIKATSPGPAVFRQQRLGESGEEFTCYKFRSMVQNAAEKGSGVYTYEDDPRVTRVGRLLRRTSFDELPQLLNILKGEMSCVGPRPPLPDHPCKYDEYSDFQRKRFEIKPGVTGIAQINGRKTLQWEERIELDVQYLEQFKKWGLLLDLKIIILTPFRIAPSQVNYNVGETAMDEEDGQ